MTEMPASRKAAVWLALIFLLGAGFGGVLGFMAGNARAHASAWPKKSPEVRRAEMVAQLDRELHLTEAQRESLDPILASFQEQFQAIHKQFEPQMKEVREASRKKIRALLRPEQQGKYDEYLKRVDQERKKAGY
jgi:Spy/CpxP family protein refolding chaperone